MSTNTKTLIIIYLIIWLFASLYFSIAEIVNFDYYEEVSKIPNEKFKPNGITWKFQGMIYGTEGDYLRAKLQSDIWPIYKWLFQSSDMFILLISCSFFGTVGAIVRMIKEKIFDKLSPT